MPAAVETIIACEGLNRLFQIGPQQPDLHLGFLPGQRVGEGEQDRGARSPIVRANETGLEERIVVAGEDEDRLLGVGRHVEFADDVVDGDGPARRGCGKVVGFEARAVFLKHLAEQVLGFLVARRTRPALPEAGDFRSVGVRMLGVKGVMQRRGLGEKRPRRGATKLTKESHFNSI